MLYRVPHPTTSACSRIYRRELFEGLRFYNGMYEDLEIFPKLILRAGKVGVIDKPVYFYRDNPSSFINTWTESRRDAVKVTRMIMESFSPASKAHEDVSADIERNLELYRAAQNRHFRANYNLLLELLRHCPEDKEGIDACCSEIKRLRRRVIFDATSRPSTILGALISYTGLLRLLITMKHSIFPRIIH